MIIPVPPILNHHPCFPQAVKAFGIETFAAKGAMTAFIASVLPRFAGCHTTRLDALFVQKCRQGLGNEFWPVSAPDIRGALIEPYQPGEHLDDPLMREGARHDNAHTPARVPILHRQATKCLTIYRDIVHEIPVPARVPGLCRGLQCRPGSNFLPYLPLRPLQAALAPDAVHTLEIDTPPTAPQKALDEAIAPLGIMLRHPP